MTNPLISVVVPIYKIDRYLGVCIESVLNQTYTNLEIILVDDGSPDRCPEICDLYAKKDTRIKVIHKRNGGLVSARKAGILSATGKYIGYVDGDDWIGPGFITHCMLLFRKVTLMLLWLVLVEIFLISIRAYLMESPRVCIMERHWSH